MAYQGNMARATPTWQGPIAPYINNPNANMRAGGSPTQTFVPYSPFNASGLLGNMAEIPGYNTSGSGWGGASATGFSMPDALDPQVLANSQGWAQKYRLGAMQSGALEQFRNLATGVTARGGTGLGTMGAGAQGLQGIARDYGQQMGNAMVEGYQNQAEAGKFNASMNQQLLNAQMQQDRYKLDVERERIGQEERTAEILRQSRMLQQKKMDDIAAGIPQYERMQRQLALADTTRQMAARRRAEEKEAEQERLKGIAFGTSNQQFLPQSQHAWERLMAEGAIAGKNAAGMWQRA